MAIKAIDIRSSTTAKDNKNTLRAGLNLLENKINIPTANAISVDIGMQNPLKNWLFLFINININAGTITPPIDAKTGKKLFLMMIDYHIIFQTLFLNLQLKRI